MNIDIKIYDQLDPSVGIKISNYEVHDIVNDIIITKGDNNKYGFGIMTSKNLQGHDIVKPQYEDIDIFKKGVACVEITSCRYNIVNVEGKYILNENCGFIHRISDTLFKIYKNGKNGKYGIVNYEGKIILKPIYDSIEYFKFNNREVLVTNQRKKLNVKGLYRAVTKHYNKKVNLYGLYDITGREMIKDNQYIRMIPVSENKIFVCEKIGFWKIIDYNNNLIKKIDEKIRDIEFNESIGITKDKTRDIIDFDGNFLFKSLKNYIVCKNAKDLVIYYDQQKDNYFVIDSKGNRLYNINIGWEDIYSLSILNENTIFYRSLSSLEQSQDKGYLVNVMNNKKINVSDFNILKDENIEIIKNQKAGLVDKDLNTLIDNIYDAIYDYKDNILGCKQDDNIYIMNNNQVIKQFKEDVFETDELDLHFEIVNNFIIYNLKYEKSKLGIISKNGEEILSPIEISNYKIVNDELILVDNYLYNINSLKIRYQLDLILNDNFHTLIQKSFDGTVNYQKIQDTILEAKHKEHEKQKKLVK